MGKEFFNQYRKLLIREKNEGLLYTQTAEEGAAALREEVLPDMLKFREWVSVPKIDYSLGAGKRCEVRIATMKRTMGKHRVVTHPYFSLQVGDVILGYRRDDWMVTEVDLVGTAIEVCTIQSINHNLDFWHPKSNTYLKGIPAVLFSMTRADGQAETPFITLPEDRIDALVPTRAIEKMVSRDWITEVQGLRFTVSRFVYFENPLLSRVVLRETLKDEGEREVHKEKLELGDLDYDVAGNIVKYTKPLFKKIKTRLIPNTTTIIELTDEFKKDFKNTEYTIHSTFPISIEGAEVQMFNSPQLVGEIKRNDVANFEVFPITITIKTEYVSFEETFNFVSVDYMG